MFEKIKNKKWLKLKSCIRYMLWFDSKPLKISSNYKLVFDEKFKNLDNWYISQKWGWFHPNSLYTYYDREFGDCVNIVNDTLVLKTKHDPIEVIKSELPDWQQTDSLPEKFTIPYKIGLVNTNASWKYGWFTADIQLPKGKYLWPAFWLACPNHWPPEIDIFEAYSTNKDLIKKNIQPNLHYGVPTDGTKDMYGGYDCRVPLSTISFRKYAVHWEKDFIRIYYDGYLIMEVTDKKILEWFNCDDCTMQIVLNNGINNVLDGASDSSMIIKNIKVYQKI